MKQIIELCRQNNITIRFEPVNYYGYLRIVLIKGVIKHVIDVSYGNLEAAVSTDDMVLPQIINAIDEINSYIGRDILEKEKKDENSSN